MQRKISEYGIPVQNGAKTSRRPQTSNSDGWSRNTQLTSSPRRWRVAKQVGQRLSMQHATKHCSGKSAMYAARMGKIWRMNESGQVSFIPDWPATFNASNIIVMQK